MNVFKKKSYWGLTGKHHWKVSGAFRSWTLTAHHPSPDSVLFLSLASSVKRSNCYMVWGGDIVATSQRSSRSNVDLEIGCLVDLAMGMLSFSANGRELGTCYQVRVALGPSQQHPRPACVQLYPSLSVFSVSTTACGGREPPMFTSHPGKETGPK